MADTNDRMRIVVYYAVWATLCATAAGVVIALIHAWFFSYHPGRPALIHTLFGDAVTALAVAAGSLLVQLGRTLNLTVLLGLALGLFDFVMYFLQMAVPATELGWVPDLAILTAVTILI